MRQIALRLWHWFTAPVVPRCSYCGTETTDLRLVDASAYSSDYACAACLPLHG